MMSCDICDVILGHDTLQVASEIISTVTDPRAMIGPEVTPPTLYSCRTILYFLRRAFLMIKSLEITLLNKKRKKEQFVFN